MSKVNETVRKETLYIGLWEIIFSVIMEAVFLCLGHWDVTVLFGNLLGGAAAVLNFFLLGLTVQKAVMDDEKRARERMKTSQSLRFFMTIVIAGIGVLIPAAFNIIAVLAALLFPRFAIFIRPLIDKRKEEKE